MVLSVDGVESDEPVDRGESSEERNYGRGGLGVSLTLPVFVRVPSPTYYDDNHR